MLIVISPAKTLDYETPAQTNQSSQPQYLDAAYTLVQRVCRYSETELSQLMQVSPKIAALNHQRFTNWQRPFTPHNAKQAILAFQGEVYTGLDAASFQAQDFSYAQAHLRILSGLYGILRPLDLMQPYRLEMGQKIDTAQGKNLYEFWGNRLTETLNQQLAQLNSTTLINLASNEYFKTIKPAQLNGEVMTPIFKDWKNGQYKVISFYAKKARGCLSRFIIQNQLTDPQAIQTFQEDGYGFEASLSTPQEWVFTRKKI